MFKQYPLSELLQQIKAGLKPEHHIVFDCDGTLIDGDVSDLNETKNAILKASKLPISIIFIGVGSSKEFLGIREIVDYECYNNLNEVSEDRKFLQFAQYADFINDPSIMVRKILEGIPYQIEDYLLMFKNFN